MFIDCKLSYKIYKNKEKSNFFEHYVTAKEGY